MSAVSNSAVLLSQSFKPWSEKNTLFKNKKVSNFKRKQVIENTKYIRKYQIVKENKWLKKKKKKQKISENFPVKTLHLWQSFYIAKFWFNLKER